MDPDAVICDLAETYHILDFRGLPATLLATLVSGLRDESRIKMAASGAKLPLRDMIAAASLDRLSLLWWAQTKGAQSGKNRPKSVLTEILGGNKENEMQTFETAEDFAAAWASASGGD